jgi:hypothetical protein
MLRIFLILICVFSPLWTLSAQKPPETEEEFEKAYKRRIQEEYLDGVYIPKDLADAFVQLNRLINDPSKAKFRNAPEMEAAKKLHFSLGRWITVNWGFYGGSRLSHYLKGLGVHHPDDMARFIIITYHRNLNREKLGVQELVAGFQKFREEERLARLKKGTILYEEKRKRDSIPGNF